MKNDSKERSPKKRPLFFLSAGEPSGDIHAAELIRELRRRFPDAQFVGYGGPEMKKAGCEILVMLTEMAVMWLGRVLLKLPTFLRFVRDAGRFFQAERPDMVILVDFPGFNWLIAKKAKKAGIDVCYFMPPQIWAWAQWRVKKMVRLTDLVLCSLPFEEKWLLERGVTVYRIGHPFLEEVRNRKLDNRFIESLTATDSLEKETDSLEEATKGGTGPIRKGREKEKSVRKEKTLATGSSPFSGAADGPGPILLVLPGSRNQEISRNLPDLLRAVREVQKRVPNVRPMVGAFREAQADTIRLRIAAEQMGNLPVYVGRTPELMKAATVALAVSGSVSMELLANKKPTVIYYRLNPLAHFVMRCFRRVKYITLVNILAADEVGGESAFYPENVRLIPAGPTESERSIMVYPEFLTASNRGRDAAAPLVEWLTDSSSRIATETELRDILKKTDRNQSPIQEAGAFIEKTYNGSV